MKIQALFSKPVERPIDGVIKADDSRNLSIELEEYVVTRDVTKGLSIFTDRYLNELTANGVWISGFFGSGKSHLLKILSLVLNGQPLPNGQRPADIILPKIEDELVRADLARVANIPARSVLFNIDQKFDGIGGDHSAPILEVFVKVLNELQGYYGKQGYIARFEHDLDVRGEFALFKATYQRINGSPWEKDREAIATARRAAFGRAYAEHFGVAETEATSLLRQMREDYRVSIESFAQMVKDYLERQPAGSRLNFFVDEVGQFIGQDSKLMLNLQTVAETLGTVCHGRAWIFVTSQADLEGVLGSFKGMEAQDISKIQGRFKTQLTLASADVREVIQKRLLAKTEDEPAALTEIYDREKDNLQTLFRFGDNSLSFRGWRGSDEFCLYYPFHPYQFDLFQRAIQQLSQHNAFTGKYLSVGERSMLAVFQEVAKTIRELEVGQLATFDLMYDGIAASIRGDMQTSLKLAERQLGDGLEMRILKALFLLKWVREFKASVRNIAILLIDRPDVDIRAHEKQVRTALAQLESQSYLQHNGDLYEFLTDVEKDIEVEIKNTEIDEAKVSQFLADALFADVLRDPKIRYQNNEQDYAYARKLDDQLVGKDAEICVNLITTEHPQHANANILAQQNMGKAELLAVLPADTRLIEQARLYLKTQKYVTQNSGNGEDTRKAVLDQRGQQNSLRRNQIQDLAKELLGQAPLYLNGTRLDTVSPGDARNRFSKAAQELIAFSYPKLKMLRGTYSEATLSAALLDQDDLLAGTAVKLTEAEDEILTYVMRNQNKGERTSVEEIVRAFERRPYGWYRLAVLTLLGRLFRLSKVELRTTELLDAPKAFELLKNSRQHANVRVRLQEQFDATQVNALKVFHHDFFDRTNAGTDARGVGQMTADAMAAEAHALQHELLSQVGRYPFLEALRPVAEQITRLGQKDYNYFLNHLAEFAYDLLTAKDDLLSPIKAFWNGAQRQAYDEAVRFLREEEANFAELPAAEVQPLRDLANSPHPYRGNAVSSARAAVTKLRKQLDELLQAERDKALATVLEQETRLRVTPEFAALDESAQQAVLGPTEIARTTIQAERFITSIRDRVQRYVTQTYPAQLAHAARLASSATAQPATGPATDKAEVSTAPPPMPTMPVSNYIHASKLRPQCALHKIATPADLEEWLAAWRTAAQAELAKGNQIIL
ncbi:MAG TPA: BREX system P-loop protein BrxC [Blastocatellia bacterium]|nr:BREX system P-loop protein BrxC [Blastocatellia bacterium]HMX26904.1 BREX system P-loop protein BrxC [Blastocatellia bacterium]HMY70264.1 BREX system P-loop protein BrxC [Blastocatellia bacterium]HMZ17552.1 BREX system P-loop protein BrxC [Blastocatellia bacterium]